MKSRISIEIDYDKNNEPVIQIIKRKSDDVRDGLIQAFLQKLQGDSSWCKIQWVNTNLDPNDEFQTIRIWAIPPSELKVQSLLMEAMAEK
jgi:hypothetical protein